EPPEASHPFFWAGYLLVDTGTHVAEDGGLVENPPSPAAKDNKTPAGRPPRPKKKKDPRQPRPPNKNRNQSPCPAALCRRRPSRPPANRRPPRSTSLASFESGTLRMSLRMRTPLVTVCGFVALAMSFAAPWPACANWTVTPRNFVTMNTAAVP